MPGACAQVKEINRLKRELAEAIDRGNDWCDQALQARAERDRMGEALKNLVVAAGMGWPFSLSDAVASARAALKETGHD
jgi:2-polyprenyl-6-methoxyphenol hydroxylase-like FAD-dependent oxidoreductase